jgi:polyhydroxyalkanoate synthesis regulator phasin
MSDEERVRRAFRILFYDLGKIRKEIEELRKRLEELEQRLSNLYRIGDN